MKKKINNMLKNKGVSILHVFGVHFFSEEKLASAVNTS